MYKHALKIACVLFAALLFYNIQASGAFEEKSLHQGCPVLKGQKWAAVKWLHMTRFPTASERNRIAAAMKADPADWMPEMAKALMPEVTEPAAKLEQGGADAAPTSSYTPVVTINLPSHFAGSSDAGSTNPRFERYRKYYK